MFADVWMHKRCAEFAGQSCPFVNGSKEYSNKPIDAQGVEHSFTAIKPEAMYLMKTRTSRCKPVRIGKSLGIHAGTWIRVEEIKR